MARRLLVLLLAGASRESLEQAIADRGEEVEVFLVAPRHVGPLEWLATDERRADAEAAARVLEAEWLLDGAAEEVGGEAGEADPVLAVQDALDRFHPDEIVVVGGGAVDPSLVSSLRAYGLPVVLAGVEPGPATLGGRARSVVRGLVSGRSQATPFAAMLAANLGLLAIAIFGAVLVGLLVWLIQSL